MDQKLEISVNQAIVGVFVLGIAIGFSGGLVAAGGFDNEEAAEMPTKNNKDSGSSVVELKNTEYPYKGIEAGVADSSAHNNSTMNVKGEPYIGSGDTKLVAYEDFECPFCQRFHQSAFPEIVEKNIRNGDVKFYFKNYPLQQLHPWALKGAIAGECALNQDAKTFWTFNKGFFENQNALSSAHKSNNFDESMTRWAEQTGLDVEKFESCYNGEKETDEVREDMEQGGRLGTPTVFVEGTKISGAQPYVRFKSEIESASS